MKLSQFYRNDFRVRYINCLRQYWRHEKKWSCIGSPKERNILLYLQGCSAKYTLGSGDTIYAKSGDIVFCPQGSEYEVEFFDFKSSESFTVGINFKLDSEAALPDSIECFELSGIGSEIAEIEQLDRREKPVIMKFNLIVSGILLSLGELSDNSRERELGIILAGVNYLREHLYEDVGIDKLAEICRVSEVYFRRIFTSKLGVSPLKYRLAQRLSKATEYLRYTDNSVSELAELLGFTDSSYFIKKFKEAYGVTPLAYRGKF